MSSRHHRRCSSLLAVLAIAGLAGCPAPNAMPPSAGTQASPTGSAAQAFLFDVDAMRASAFERPTPALAAETGLQLLVSAPEVRHDPATGRTIVSLAVTNAGAPVAGLSLQVLGDRQPVSAPLIEAGTQASGTTRQVELVFDNPQAASFSMQLDFKGALMPAAPAAPTRRVLAGGFVSASASSSYSTLTPERAVDGNAGTQWANGGYQEREAWLTLDTGAVQSLPGLALKMQPQSGEAYYRLEVSNDGTSFTPVTGTLRNASWNSETKALPAGTQGRYVRIHFFNSTSSPEGRFSVFEAALASGGSGPTPTPTSTPMPTPSSSPSATPSSGPVTGTSASSTLSGFTPARAVDGDLNTQWANGGYKEASAWLAVDLGTVQSLGSLGIKLQPLAGAARYAIEVSNDGTSFTTAASGLNNTSWNLETKTLPAGTQGRYVRLRFTNDPTSPMDRFSVYELRGPSGAVPTPTPTSTPTPAPTATPSLPPPSGNGYNNNFEQYGAGADPAEFVDPNDEGYSYSWMPRVRWRVASQDGSQQYLHDGLSNQANLSFRRYRGGAFFDNGRMPNRYFASLDVTPIRSYTYAPTGDQGTQFYYLTPTKYVELIIKPNLFEVWVANDAQPFQNSGWQRLYYTSVTTTGGQKRQLAAEVDAANGTIKAYLDGQLKTTLTHGMLTTQAHYFALRGTGNVVAHDNLHIEAR